MARNVDATVTFKSAPFVKHHVLNIHGYSRVFPGIP